MDTGENRSKSILNNRTSSEILIRNIPGLIVIFIFLLLLLSEHENSKDEQFLTDTNSLLIIIGISFTLFTYFFRYLESDKSVDRNSRMLRNELNEFRHIVRTASRSSNSDSVLLEEIKNLKDKFIDNQTNGLDLNESDKTKLFELFETKLEKILTQEFLKTIQEKFGADIISSERYSDLLRDLIELKDRIRS